jgi:hypothetical protein
MTTLREPRVHIIKTENANDRWLVSGAVTFSIGQCDGPDTTIKIDFAGARSEAHAIQIAASRLKQISDLFSQQASRLIAK